MVAVDTNVLIRLVVADHAAQAARAAAVFRSGPVFIAKSVLLEAEWVLRYSYQLGAEAILRSLRAVLGLENLSVEDPKAISAALHSKGILNIAPLLYCTDSNAWLVG